MNEGNLEIYLRSPSTGQGIRNTDQPQPDAHRHAIEDVDHQLRDEVAAHTLAGVTQGMVTYHFGTRTNLVAEAQRFRFTSTILEDVEASQAVLAGLRDPQSVLDFARQLTGILDHFATMSGIDTSGVAPIAHPIFNQARQRPDVVTETDQRAALQAAAPQVEGGYYLVPRVIE